MREEGIHNIEVHVGGVCVREREDVLEILALHRSPTRALYPGYWEGFGGQVPENTGFDEAVLLRLAEETGLTGKVIRPFATYRITSDAQSGAETLIPGLRFLVKADDNKPVVLDPQQHQAYAWVASKDLRDYHWIPGLVGQLEQGIELYRQIHGR